MKRNWVVLSALAVALVVLAGRRTGGSLTTKLEGPAPAWAMPDLAGKTVRSQDFVGRIVVLNFWATWCPPCRREIPDFIEFARSHDTNRVLVIGAAVDESPELVRQFARDQVIPYPVTFADLDTRIAFRAMQGIPVTYVIDASGSFVSRHLGPMTARQLEDAVNEAANSAETATGTR